jgi:DNA polymerase-3 subunit delta'
VSCYARQVPFSHIEAQTTALATLTRALRSGRVHHAYRFEGPDGVGKELAAFALAQALVCTEGAPEGCGACDACRRAGTLAAESPRTPLHPDVIVIERGLYPAEAIGRSRGEVSEISVDQVRKLVLSSAAFPPHEGRARVFIIRRADELSIGAANALLKTLEEPHDRTHFILLSSRAERLLPTIRSRTIPVRFGPLPSELLRRILKANGAVGDDVELALELAAGSASAALELVDVDAKKEREAFIEGTLAALRAADLGAATAFAESNDKGREDLRGLLRALGAHLARAARGDAASEPARAFVGAKRYGAVARAVASLERNASPTLTLIELLAEMRAAGPAT